MSSLILGDLILKVISQLSALFLNDATTAKHCESLCCPLQNRRGFLAQQGLSMCLTSMQEDPVVETPCLQVPALLLNRWVASCSGSLCPWVLSVGKSYLMWNEAVGFPRMKCFNHRENLEQTEAPSPEHISVFVILITGLPWMLGLFKTPTRTQDTRGSYTAEFMYPVLWEISDISRLPRARHQAMTSKHCHLNFPLLPHPMPRL